LKSTEFECINSTSSINAVVVLYLNLATYNQAGDKYEASFSPKKANDLPRLRRISSKHIGDLTTE
jgi:hypothetical protein